MKMPTAIVDKYLKLENYKKDKTLAIELLVNIGCCILIALAIFTCISANMVGGTLWVDEAMLAASISKRSIWELTSQPLEMNQSAPIIYLYLVKIITLVFGNSEITLRLWSLIAYILTLGAIYYLLKKVLQVKLPLISTALVASLGIMILYSFEFKPYMTDCLAIMVALILYHLYNQKKISAIALTACYMISVWANPVCFFIGGALLYNLIEAAMNKDYKQIRTIVLSGVFILASFAGYYFYWLKPVIDTGYMQNFWAPRNLTVFPINSHTLYLQKIIVADILVPLGKFGYLIFWIAVLGFFVNLLWIKNKIVHIIYLGLIITLIASAMGMFPIQDRMCLFFYPFFLILPHFVISKLYSKYIITNIALLALAVSIAFALLSTSGISKYMNRQNVYKEENNMAIEYIEKNIKEGEALYVMRMSTPVYLYHKKYDLKDVPHKLIIEDVAHEWEPREEEILLMQKNAPTYILNSRGDIPQFLNETLSQRGNLELKFEAPGAWVYYYTNKELELEEEKMGN